MYKYILRFSLAPSRDFDEKMEKLLEFCENALIDDVMFFIAPEELSVGHITLDEAKKWTDVILRAKNILTERGITTSLNPWVTLSHYDGGRKLQEGQNFRTMVGINGEVAETVVCPLDTAWRKYYVELMKFYVETLDPDVLWFEDDMRLSNHEPVWYGCFCEEHLKLINERLGAAYTREELVKAAFEDENVRKAVLEVARFTIEDTLSYIIENLPNQKRFGLMTSGAEGALRDARRHDVLYSILAQNGEKPYNRLNLGAYRQCGLQEYAWTLNKSTFWHRSMASFKADFVSEMEDNPHTLYTKSANFMRYQLLTSAPLCLAGTTLSIFEFNGNGIVNGERYAKVLKEVKPFLSKIGDLKLAPWQMQGVYVLYDENSAFTMSPKKANVSCLHPQDSWWFAYLEQLGAACVFGTDVQIKNRVVALGGQVVRNYTKKEIVDLFESNYVVVGADCAAILCEMGLGALIGAKSCEFWKERDGRYSMEELATGEEVCGVKELRATAQFFCGDYLKIEYGDVPKKVFTRMLNYRENVVGEGIVQVGNALIFPFTGRTNDAKMPISLLNPLREYALKTAIDKNTVEPTDVYFVEQENVCPYVFKANGKTYILLVNYSDDEFTRLTLKTNVEYDRLRLITPEAPREKTIGFEFERGTYWLQVRLGAQSCIALACEKHQNSFDFSMVNEYNMEE